MAVQQGGQVEASSHREFGYAEVRAHGHSALLDGIEDSRSAGGDSVLGVWMSHGDKVAALPPGFELMASTPSCPIAGMADDTRRFYGVQFHPEVAHTRAGRGDPRALRARHLRRHGRLDDARPRRRGGRADPRPGRRRGGRPRAVGRRRLDRRRGPHPPRHRRPADLHLRRQRAAAPGRGGAGRWRCSPAACTRGSSTWTPATQFLERLAGVTDPEQKRKIIGATFIDVFEEEARRPARRAFDFLAQGTLYPDVIESVSVRGRRPPSRATTTSAACPSACASSWSSRCASCSRTKCARSGRRSASTTEFVVPPAVPGPGPGGAHPRRGHARARSTCCGAPTRSSPRRCDARGLVPAELLAELSPCCCRCRASA